jgi:hypothetical protein
MSAKKQVFSSASERTNFYKLSRQWEDKYRLYHNLPFLNVFDTKNLVNPAKIGSWDRFNDRNEPLRLTVEDVDFNRLKKTSIDYTLCDHNDRPLVCIEFDGLKDGFNVGTEYRFDGPPDDPWRELITALKLRVAHGSLFPYFVVGYSHFEDLAENVQLTMVDGIIGEVLSSLEAHRRIQGGFESEEVGWPQEDFDMLPPDEQQMIIQDWVIGVEVEAEMTHNPISVRAAELERQIPVSCSTTYLSYPDADKAKTIPERAKLLDRASFNGCRCELHGGGQVVNGRWESIPCPLGPISATVWLPNFKTPGCGSMLGLVENLAKLVALEQARKKMERHPS